MTTPIMQATIYPHTLNELSFSTEKSPHQGFLKTYNIEDVYALLGTIQCL